MRLPALVKLTAARSVQTWAVWTEGADICTEYGLMGGALQTSRKSCQGKNVGRANATTAAEQAEAEARAMHAKQIRKGYRGSLQEAQALQVTPMLASTWNPTAPLAYPVMVQPKLDGLRCLAWQEAGEVVLMSRGNKPWEHLTHIRAELKPLFAFLDPGTILDGEIYLHGTPLQDIVSLTRRPQEGSWGLCYHIYDAIPGGDPEQSQYVRLGLFCAAWAQYQNDRDLQHNPFLRLVETRAVPDREGLDRLHSIFLSQGYEGTILRDPAMPYRYGARAKGLQKRKDWKTEEFKIISFAKGRGKAEGCPIFQCITPEGKPFDVMPRGTAKTRADLLKRAPYLVGARLTVKFFQLTPDGIPQFPVGVADRLDHE